MKAGALAALVLLAGCASTPAPPGTLVDADRFAAAAVPGASSASVQAALGATQRIAFDSGYQVWLYQVARTHGRLAESVILFDRNGLVVKTRQREPD